MSNKESAKEQLKNQEQLEQNKKEKQRMEFLEEWTRLSKSEPEFMKEMCRDIFKK